MNCKEQPPDHDNLKEQGDNQCAQDRYKNRVHSPLGQPDHTLGKVAVRTGGTGLDCGKDRPQIFKSYRETATTHVGQEFLRGLKKAFD